MCEEDKLQNQITDDEIRGQDEQYVENTYGEKFEDISLNERLANLIVEKLLDSEQLKNLIDSGQKNNRTKSRSRDTKPEYRTTRSDRRRSSIRFKDLVEGRLPNLTLSSKYHFMEEYLQGLSVVNHELDQDFERSGFPVKKTEIFLRRYNSEFPYRLPYDYCKSNLVLLNRIERFMLILAVKSLPAFIEEPIENKNINYEQKITVIGKEFLYLISQYHHISRFDHEYLTTFVKIFSNFLSDNFQSYSRYSSSLDVDVDSKSIIEFNTLLWGLKKSLIQGKYENKITNRYMMPHTNIIFRDFNGFKKYLKALAGKIENFRTRLSPLKKEDTVIYRFQLEIYCNGVSVRYDFFGKFFTALIKAIKQSNEFSGLCNHISIWKEKSKNVLEVDFVLFFNANEPVAFNGYINRFDCVEEKLKEIANSLLEKEVFKQVNYDDIKKEWELGLYQIPILSEFSPEYIWLLEANSPRWKIVNTKLISYFYILGGYERNYVDDISSRVSASRGKITEPKK
ncbi:hypothetical protein [Acinetobacter pollinis]|uniref:hypothetical protein n=1 Tax=Acinetobacter pollinis TaxID=2605270 RepID=UPI0018A28C59|nr:hypothetical protein [Acinetobacter pollinis]MBF7689814.1 hypothetical protein [Acinetobacter pollinis]MBF7697334.1 hypothetical protein [Acinetobacter pollinis]